MRVLLRRKSNWSDQQKKAGTRREFLALSSAALCGMCLGPRATAQGMSADASLRDHLMKIEAQSGGRMGVALFDTGTGRIIGHRVDEIFPMCSTFKVLAVAAVLARVDEGRERLQRSVPVMQSDILEYAPVTSQHVGASGMTIGELCEAAITLSDNTAANLLLHSLGGPGAVTAFARRIGDSHTRLDRTEPTLNEATPGDPRDTTTPRAMAQDLNLLVLGSGPAPASRALLKKWMVQCKTGDKKIRSAVPKGYIVGDKTGSGDRNTSNDVAVIWPGNRQPWILTIYLTGATSDSSDQQSAVIAEAARACITAMNCQTGNPCVFSSS
jgi:beta-lactamase class A